MTKQLLFSLILLFACSTSFSQRYSYSDQLRMVNRWLQFKFEPYSNVELNSNTHYFSFVTTREGFKQYIENAYLEITDNGSTWSGEPLYTKAIWKAYGKIELGSITLEFNDKGYLIAKTNYSNNKFIRLEKYTGNYPTKDQRLTLLYEGHETFEEEPYYKLELENYYGDANQSYYVELNIPHNKYTLYNSEKEAFAVIPLIDGKKNGAFDITYPDKTRSVGTFEMGNLVGSLKAYDSNGKLSVESTFINGELFGTRKEYNDGNLTNVTEYENGEKNGEAITYKNGVIIGKGYYRNDNKYGEWLEEIYYNKLEDIYAVKNIIEEVSPNDYKALTDDNYFRIVNYNKDEYVQGKVILKYLTGEDAGYYYYDGEEFENYGDFKILKKNGNVLAEGKYKNDELQEIKCYDENQSVIPIDLNEY